MVYGVVRLGDLTSLQVSPRCKNFSSLVLCNISLIEEFRVYFGAGQGAHDEHSRSYVRNEQRWPASKEAEIVDRNLCYRALVL